MECDWDSIPYREDDSELAKRIRAMSDEEFHLLLGPDEPCITEAALKRLGLLPVPDWARKPPKRKKPGLFDDIEPEDREES